MIEMSVLFIQTAHKCMTIYEKNTVNSVRFYVGLQNDKIAQEILKKNKSASVLDAFVGEKDVIQSRIGRYKRTAKTYLENVCDGRLV
jgi:hypothetical protein